MRYAIHLAYNGTNYCGWQAQPELPTVQFTLESALSTLLRTPIAIVGCGRTDTGVHASDFYAHFDLDGPLADNLVFKLNSYLPPDIAIFDIFPVADNFHARFSALSRTYKYYAANKEDDQEYDYAAEHGQPDVLVELIPFQLQDGSGVGDGHHQVADDCEQGADACDGKIFN